MKLIVDGIIENLQNGGGCTVYFEQLLSFYQTNNSKLDYIQYQNNFDNISLKGQNTTIHSRNLRFLERWRDVDISSFSNDSVFHSTHYRLPENKKNNKIITTVHDFNYELFRSGPAQWMHSWQKYRAIKNSDYVICVSHSTANDLLKYCPVAENKIRVVHNGVSDRYYPLTGVQKTNEVLFVGTRGGYKNFLTAVDAMVLATELFLSIVGGGPLNADEIALLDSKIPRRYKHLGRVSDDELNGIYNRVFCLLYPSSYEGFGIPVIEAMRCGCPVIATNVSSIPEVAGNAACLLDKPLPAAIADALRELDSAVIYQKFQNKGFAQAAKFSWEKCYQETNAIYNECY